MSSGWPSILALFAQTQDERELERLFGALLTIEERAAMVHRKAILTSLLIGNESQRELAARLQVSIATVTRGANMLKLLTEEERKALLAQLNQTGVDDVES